MTEARRLWAHFARDRWGLLGSSVLLGFAALVPAGVLWVFEALLATLDGRPRPGWGLGALCGALVALTAVRLALVYARTRWTKAIGLRATARLRARVLSALLATPSELGQDTGHRVAMLCDQVDGLQYAVSAWVTALRNPIVIVTVVATAAWMVPDLVALGLLMVPFVAGVAWWGGQRLRQRGRAFRESRSALIGLTADQLGGASAIRRAGAEPDELQRFEVRNQADRRARWALESDRVLPSAMTQVAVVLCAALLLWLGGTRVMEGELAFSELAAFAGALALLHRPLGGLAEVWGLVQHSLGTLEAVHDLLAEHSEPVPLDSTADARLPTGPLTAEGLTVQRGERPIFTDLDAAFAPGQITALTGASGVGKSTLLHALEGSLAAQGGTVHLGGAELRSRGPGRARDGVVLVPQNPYLFARSVRDNVALGRPAADEVEIRAALRRAEATFVDGLPEGLDTPVGERGCRLSGGEAQRLALARALLRDARVLLLDEATNQVDAATEGAMLATLRRLSEGRVVVLVAHRPSTLEACDQVWELTPSGLKPWAKRTVLGSEASLRA